jgi:hypothetical protein
LLFSSLNAPLTSQLSACDMTLTLKDRLTASNGGAQHTTIKKAVELPPVG